MKEFLNRVELAQKLGLNPKTIYNLVRQRKIPFYRAAARGIYLFKLDEVVKAMHHEKTEVFNG